MHPFHFQIRLGPDQQIINEKTPPTGKMISISSI